MKCARLKEKCEWLEVGEPGPVVDKGKGKVKEQGVATSPRGGEKQKKKKTVKIVIDDKMLEVAGPSGSKSGLNSRAFLERMDKLTAMVEVMTGQMARITDSTQSVSQSNNHLSAGLETFLEECRFFMASEMQGLA